MTPAIYTYYMHTQIVDNTPNYRIVFRLVHNHMCRQFVFNEQYMNRVVICLYMLKTAMCLHGMVS